MADKQRLLRMQMKFKCLKSISVLLNPFLDLLISIQLLMKLPGFIPLT